MFNIFFLAFIAVVIGLVLAIFITRKGVAEQAQMHIPEDDARSDPKEYGPLTMAHLKRLAEKLCEQNQLTVRETIEQGQLESIWVTETTNEFFYGNYIFCFLEVTPERPHVTLADVLEFKDFIKSVSSAKGFYFTTGYFLRDIHQPLEGPKVTLYNRKRVLEELKHYNLPLPEPSPAQSEE